MEGNLGSIVISENLRRTGLSANAGTGTGLEWTPGGGEASEIRMFNHWATGLRSGLLPQVVVLQHQKLAKKRTVLGEVFVRVLTFGPRGKFLEGFGRFLEVSRMFFTGVSPSSCQVGGEL